MLINFVPPSWLKIYLKVSFWILSHEGGRKGIRKKVWIAKKVELFSSKIFLVHMEAEVLELFSLVSWLKIKPLLVESDPNLTFRYNPMGNSPWWYVSAFREENPLKLADVIFRCPQTSFIKLHASLQTHCISYIWQFIGYSFHVLRWIMSN